MSKPFPHQLNPVLSAAIARAAGTTVADVEETVILLTFVSLPEEPPITLYEVLRVLTWPQCTNPGCPNPQSNRLGGECFECLFEPYGTAWEEEWGPL